MEHFSCVPFLIWQLNCASSPTSIGVDGVHVRPEAVSQLTKIIYTTFPNAIRSVTVEGSHIIDILGGTEVCPVGFKPNNIAKVDRLTREFNGEQVKLLRTLIENQILQSARSYQTVPITRYLMSKGLTLEVFLRLLNEEIRRTLTPGVVDELLTRTQPQSILITPESPTGCQVKPELPVIVFSAAVLERITNQVMVNPILSPVISGLAPYLMSYTDPLSPVPSSTPGIGTRTISSTTNLWFWIILIVVLIGLGWLIFRLLTEKKLE